MSAELIVIVSTLFNDQRQRTTHASILLLQTRDIDGAGLFIWLDGRDLDLVAKLNQFGVSGQRSWAHDNGALHQRFKWNGPSCPVWSVRT
jgi:hypothetical protein